MNKNQQASMRPIWIVVLLNMILIIAFLIFYFFDRTRGDIVYVDSFKLFSNYKGTLAVKGKYEKKLGVWKSNIDTLTAEFNNEVSKYEKSKSKMSSREKQLSEELLGTKRQQLENYRSVVAENASKEDKEVTTKITSEINEFLKRYGESHHLEYILGATNAGNVIYAKSGRDVTEDVLKELNNEYQTSTK